jgi:hypothetical protein
MAYDEIFEKYAELIMKKCKCEPKSAYEYEYKKIEIMACMIMAFNDIMDGVKK